MKRIVGIGILALIAIGCSTQKTHTEVESRVYDFGYTAYARLLAENVVGHQVNYSSIKAARSSLDSLVDDIAAADLEGTSLDQKLAFYCNAYNILTIRSIVDVYPVASIRDIDGVWDRKQWLVAGEGLTLNQIEHEILRKDFSEPRIHVAVNCSSTGCPPLLPVPFYPDSIDQLLTRAAREFAASETHNKFDTQKNEAHISSIFDWYGDDFTEKYYKAGAYPSLSRKKNAALSFLIAHLPEEQAASLSGLDLKASYLDYDWSLNDTKSLNDIKSPNETE